MELVLWRHADAVDGAPDLERELTPKGRKQAKRVAAWLNARLPADCQVFVSPARRAQQTAEALERKFKTRDALAPGARAAEILAAAGWPGKDATVLVVGHQPTLGQAAALILTGRESDWSMRKAAAWWFRCRDGEVVLRAAVDAELA